MLRADAKAQVKPLSTTKRHRCCCRPRLIPKASRVTRVQQETFKFIGRGSSEANLKPEQLVILQQFKRAEEVGQSIGLSGGR